MYILAMVLSAVWLSTSYIVLNERERTAQFVQLQGDVSATNFLAYRESVVRYLNANPLAAGTIPDSSLVFGLGFIRNPLWTNVVVSNVLYVYSTSAPGAGMIKEINKKTTGYMFVGLKDSTGALVSATGSVIAVSLPPAIPVGALVYVGS